MARTQPTAAGASLAAIHETRSATEHRILSIELQDIAKEFVANTRHRLGQQSGRLTDVRGGQRRACPDP